jgi:glycosyltransferase involved in cell wall biosynthesis
MRTPDTPRVGINGIALSISIRAGIYRHVWEIGRELDRLWPEAAFFLYTNDSRGLSAPSSRWTIRQEPIARLRKLRPSLWLKTRCGRLAAQDNLDVFWSGSGLSPIVPKSIPVCLTVHDINLLLAPQTMTRFNRLTHRAFFRSDLKRAAAVLSVSAATAEKLKELLDTPTHAITPNAAASQFYPRDQAEQQAALTRLKVTEPFCLVVGTIEPRKNIANLLSAFELLHQRNELRGHSLVLVGKVGWRSEPVTRLLEKYQGTWLKHLGYVPDDELAALYSATNLYVLPSIYEGFGIGVVEARACGAPVAVTDIPELTEYCGSDAIRIPGADPESIAAALRPALQRAPARCVADPATLPSWAESAARLKGVLEQLIRRG